MKKITHTVIAAVLATTLAVSGAGSAHAFSSFSSGSSAPEASPPTQEPPAEEPPVQEPPVETPSLGLESLNQMIESGGKGEFTIGVVADSTMNDGPEAARLWWRKLAPLFSEDVRREYQAWSYNSRTWSSIVDAPGNDNGNSLTMWNGAWPGARLAAFNPATRAEMFGDKHIDLLVFSIGHNHKDQDPEDFKREVNAWLDAWFIEHPETSGVLLVSQNPTFAPAAFSEEHLARQRQMSEIANEGGFAYAPALETWLDLPDGGASLVMNDGLHPTFPLGGSLSGDFGSVVTADAMMQALKN